MIIVKSPFSSPLSICRLARPPIFMNVCTVVVTWRLRVYYIPIIGHLYSMTTQSDVQQQKKNEGKKCLSILLRLFVLFISLLSCSDDSDITVQPIWLGYLKHIVRINFRCQKLREIYMMSLSY